VYRDVSHAAEIAHQQGLATRALRENGIVDRVVAERPDAADEPEDFCVRLGDAIAQELAALQLQPGETRRLRRLERYRLIGRPL
jgi:acetyl-CoA carboxylase carboxyl transferase subunit beta